ARKARINALLSRPQLSPAEITEHDAAVPTLLTELRTRRSSEPLTGSDEERARAFATELRKWWSFDDRQCHTHSWHSREDFIEKKLPELLAAAIRQGAGT